METINSSDLEIFKVKPYDDLSSFECGNEDLNEFIKLDALKQMNANLNVTYLCRYQGEIVAFSLYLRIQSE